MLLTMIIHSVFEDPMGPLGIHKTGDAIVNRPLMMLDDDDDFDEDDLDDDDFDDDFEEDDFEDEDEEEDDDFDDFDDDDDF